MKLVQTPEGFEATLRPAGLQRWTGATFLTVWLTFWAFGEVFVVCILAGGAWALFTGRPPRLGQSPLELGPALAVGLFLLCWLAFWTLGGFAAGQEWLRLLFGRDRLATKQDGIEITHGYGVFAKREFYPWEKVLRFYRPPSGLVLKVETPAGARELTQMGTARDLAELESALNAALLRPAPSPEAGLLPDDWRELTTLEGAQVVTANPATRRKQAWFVAIVFFLFASTAFALFDGLRTRPNLAPLLVIVLLPTIALGWVATTLFRARNEWKIGRGSLVLQRRNGLMVTPKFSAVGLKLVESHDSDNDTWYRLVGVAAGAPTDLASQRKGKFERLIYRCSSDPVDARKFGAWLAQRSSLPFDDRTTPQASAEDVAKLLDALAGTGRFGNWAAAMLKRLPTKR